MQKQKGFTLIELLVVVAIIGVLAAVGVLAFNGFLNNAKETSSNRKHKDVVSFITAWKGKCLVTQGVANRASQGFPTCTYCVVENIEYEVGMEYDATGICNTPLSNLNKIFAGYFVVNGYKSPFDANENGVEAKECGHTESCYDNANKNGVTYINFFDQIFHGPNLYSGTFQIKTCDADCSNPIITNIPWDSRE